MAKVFLIVVVLVGLAVLGLSVQVIFKKSHKFPDFHIGRNKNMKKLGIGCATSFDKQEQATAWEEESARKKK